MMGGKFYWKVVTNGGGTEIVHGYFTSLSAATQYALDIYHSDIPLAFLIESEPDYAKNGPMVSCEEMKIMAWDQTTYFDIEDCYGEIEGSEEIGTFRVTLSIVHEKLYINEGIFRVPSFQTAPDFLKLCGASARTVNCLKRDKTFSINNIYYVAEHMDDLFKVRNLGRKSIEEIKDILKATGIHTE